ncbi:hypothetical protein [Acinetobacter johnsonii]|uniref:hypothetical protein n=1 Tax=Acinetobacter johnsonii TaxID=40214 RepID=UPI003AF776C0
MAKLLLFAVGVDMRLIEKLVEESRRAHSNWFNQFNQNDIELLSSIGLSCGANHNFFKQEILNIFDALRNRKLKKIPRLYHRFVNRYLELVPEHIKIQVDRRLLEEDQYYSAWFFNRQMFIFDYLVAKDNFNNVSNRRSYLLWAPLIDIHAPEDCYQFQNKVFHVSDLEFEKLAIEHWKQPRRGCRCALITLTEDKAKARQQEFIGGLNGK